MGLSNSQHPVPPATTTNSSSNSVGSTNGSSCEAAPLLAPVGEPPPTLPVSPARHLAGDELGGQASASEVQAHARLQVPSTTRDEETGARQQERTAAVTAAPAPAAEAKRSVAVGRLWALLRLMSEPAIQWDGGAMQRCAATVTALLCNAPAASEGGDVRPAVGAVGSACLRERAIGECIDSAGLMAGKEAAGSSDGVRDGEELREAEGTREGEDVREGEGEGEWIELQRAWRMMR